MEGKHNIFQGEFVKDALGNISPISRELYKQFVDNLAPNQRVEVFMEATVSNGTSLQIAKIHVCIRELAKEIGYSFEDMKKVIKERTGLIVNDEYKSFADCSREELALVIQSIIEAGDTVGINFR